MVCGPSKMRRFALWSPPLGVLRFNINGAARSQSTLANVKGVLRNNKCEVLFMFSKHVGVCDSSEGEVLAILKAL